MSRTVDEEKRLKKIKDIMASCHKTCIEKGLGAVSMRDLAAGCGINVQGLYYYYHSKRELILACVKDCDRQLYRGIYKPFLEQVLKTGTFEVEWLLNETECCREEKRFWYQIVSSAEYGDDYWEEKLVLKERLYWYYDQIAQKHGIPETRMRVIYKMMNMALDRYLVLHNRSDAVLLLNYIKAALDKETLDARTKAEEGIG